MQVRNLLNWLDKKFLWTIEWDSDLRGVSFFPSFLSYLATLCHWDYWYFLNSGTMGESIFHRKTRVHPAIKGEFNTFWESDHKADFNLMKENNRYFCPKCGCKVPLLMQKYINTILNVH